MSDLKHYSNLYADLSQGSYNNRPNQFPYSQKWTKEQKEAYQQGESVLFDFQSQNGGEVLGDKGKVYLQPDKIITKQVTNAIQTPKPNGGYNTEKVTSTVETNLSQDEFTGFNSYFVTDKPSVEESRETYFVTRGSDSFESFHNLQTDWIRNNGKFTLFDSYISQAKVATKEKTRR